MALAGKGDPRWIVESREDGRNVNNWHWTERNAFEWAKRRIDELLLGSPIQPTAESQAPARFVCRTVKVESVSGDCVLYNRKNRLKAVYDLRVKAKWEARPVGGASSSSSSSSTESDGGEGGADGRKPELLGKGSYEFELYDDNPDISVFFDTDARQAEQCKQCMKEQGRAVISNCMRQLLQELRSGADSNMGVGAAASQMGDASIDSRVNEQQEQAAAMRKGASATVTGTTAAASGGSGGMRKFEITETFKAPREQVFRALSDPQLIRMYTASNAVFQMPADGGQFSMFDGQVRGENMEVVRPERIVQRWRMREWQPERHHSTVTMTLKEGGESSDTTRLRLVHESVPAEALERTRAGWRDRVFGRLRVMLNMGGSLGRI